MTSRAPVVRLLALAALVAVSGPILAIQQRPDPSDLPLPDFDIRATAPGTGGASNVAQGGPASGFPRGRRARLNPHTGALRLLDAPGLSVPRNGSAAAVRAVVGAAGDRLGLDPEDFESLQAIRDYTSASTGLRHVVYRQSFAGIPVFEGIVSVHIDRAGSLVRMTSSAARGVDRAQGPALPAAQAAIEAARNVRPAELFMPVALEAVGGATQAARFARGPFGRDVGASLTWFAVDGRLRLAWHVTIEPAGVPQFYDVLIDAVSGELLLRRNRVLYTEGLGRVVQSEAGQARDPRLPDPLPASDSTCPPPFNHELRDLTSQFRDPSTVLFNSGRLEGNNTRVMRGNTSTPAASGSFDGARWVFDFPFNSAGAAETAMFFAVNYAHDFFYDLGFDEAAGNFQVDNFGRGGVGGDSVTVVARAAGRNNATFLPAPEGSSPIISMFLWDGIGCWAEDVDGDGLLDLDGDFDLDIVLHEFHHGVSHRLNTAFTGSEADAIGEGGSDFFAYSINGDTILAEYSRPGGIRSINSKTYADWYCLLGLICSPHANGEIFANALWDVRERFRADGVRGSEAAAVNESHQLYVDALKLSPPAPTMLDMRDAMLQADALRNPGSGQSLNYCRLWESFAGRGMGVNATDTADNGSNVVGADTTVPDGCDAPPPPPTVTLTVTVDTATEAGPTNGVFTISRGEARASGTTVSYSRTGTATHGIDYVSIPTSVTIPPGAVSVDVVITPIDDSLVEADETVVLTLRTSSAYVVGTPSKGTVKIVSDDTLPDLVVSSFTVPTMGGEGLDIQVTDTTKNQGTAAAPESTTSFFLSANSSWDVNDTLIGARTVPELAVDGTSSVTTVLTLPAEVSAGTYFILAKADGPLAVTEISETNNVRADSIRIGPDLLVSALSVPGAAGQDTSIQVTDTTKNNGGGSAGASSTRFFLSTNASLSDDDRPLGTRPVPALAPGEISQVATAVTIPLDVATGSYYLIAAADHGNGVAESLESNNTRAALVRIGPDLQVSSISAPAKVASGSVISVTETTKNAGQGAAGPSTTAYYLSANTNPDPQDYRLTPVRAVGSLAAGGTSSATVAVTLPVVTAGKWYLIGVADDEGVVAETFETNNDRYTIVNVGPDLDVTSLSASSSAVAGATISISSTVKNIGAETAGPSTTRFYLSANTTFDPSDILMSGERSVPELAPNASSASTTSVTLPSGISGKFYIIAVADAAGVVAESNETNNTMARAITINP